MNIKNKISSVFLILLALCLLSVSSQAQLGRQRKVQQDDLIDRLAEDNPAISRADIIVLRDELLKRRVGPAQMKRFVFNLFKQGRTLVGLSEQKEIDDINEQMLNTYSVEEFMQEAAIYDKVDAGELPTKEEVNFIRQLQKRAVNALPESVKLRLQALMGKVMRAGLKAL